MRKKIAVLGFVALLLVVCVGVGFATEPSTAVQPIGSDSSCPAVGCASGECHGFGNVPSPNGVHEMICPEVGCASVECHAWGTMVDRYHQASDASLNLWILMPTILVLGIVLATRVLSRKGAHHEQTS